MSNRANVGRSGRQKLRPADFGYSEFSLRVWQGMTFGVWLGVLKGNLRRISARRIPVAILITLTTLFQSAMAFVAWLIVVRRADRHPIEASPIFILGFWRSGTTLLHDLMVTDPRFAYPTLYQCLCPNTFLATGWLANIVDWFMPNQRPMDGMSASVHVPQEDEFAILNMGLKTPYRYLAFPSLGAGEKAQHRFWPQDDREWQDWRQRWLRFLRHVAYRNRGKRLVLKSPPHTGRVEQILKVFPNAKFVHISRRPDQLMGSNLKMNRAMAATQSLEIDVEQDGVLEDYILTVHRHIYDAYFRDTAQIASGNLIEVRYEDLVRDAGGEIERIYRQLELGPPGEAIGRANALMAQRASYRADRYETSCNGVSANMPTERPGMMAEYAARFGYGPVKD
jgi:hypothetical protein